MPGTGGGGAGASRRVPVLEQLARWAWVPVPIALALVVAFILLDWRSPHENVPLLLVLNFAFSTLPAIVVAGAAARTFVATGNPEALLLGAGNMVMGASFLAAPIVGSGDPNDVATIHNLGMLASSVLQLGGAIAERRRLAALQVPRLLVAISYSLAVGLVLVLAIGAAWDLTPTFFVAGRGGSPMRQVVLGASASLLGAAAVLFLSGKGGRFTFGRLYGSGLLLLATGLVAVLVQRSLGTPIGWTGRAAQYLGGLWLALSAIGEGARARRWALPIEAELESEKALSQQLREANERLAFVLEGSGDGYWHGSLRTGHVTWSERFAAMFGYRASELAPDIGAWQAMVHPDEREASEATLRALLGGEIDRYEADRRFRHRDGHWVWTHVRAKVVVKDADGKPLTMAGTCTDISARKAREEELRTTKERLSLVIDGSGDGFWDWDVPSGKVKYSRGWASMLGYDLDDLERDVATWKRMVHPDDLGPTMALVEAHLRGETPQYESEHRLRHRDGHWMWILDRGKVLVRDGAGRPVRMVGTHSYVSRRKEVEQRLAESEARYRSLVERLPDGMFVIQDGRIVVANPSAARVTGFASPEHLIGTGPEQRLSPEDLAKVGAATRRALDGETVESFDIAIHHPDGGLRTVETYGGLVSLGGRPAVQVVMRDVTDQRAAARALAESEARFRTLADSSPVGIFQADARGRNVYLNSAGAAILGLTPDGARGEGWHATLHPEDRDRALHGWREALASGQIYRGEIRFVRPTGEVVDAEVHGDALRDEKGLFAGAVGVMVDVTERHRERHRLEAAVEGSGSGVVDVDVATGTVYRSPRAWEIIGWRPGSLSPTVAAALDLVHPDDATRVGSSMRGILSGGADVVDEDLRLRSSAGAYRWIHLALRVVERSATGKPRRISGTLTDVSRRKQYESVVREGARRLETFVAQVPVAVAMFDREMRYLAASREWLKSHPLQGVDVIGRSLYEVFPSIPERWKAVHRRCLAGAVERSEEDRLPRPGGGFDWVRWEAHPWREPSGEVGGIVIFSELTTAKRALQEQVAVNSRLAAMGTLVAGLAHEINNPLAAEVAGQALALEVARSARQQLVSGAPIDPDANVRELDLVIEALEDAQEGGHRVAGIVRDLAAFARPESSRERVRLRGVVDHAMRWVPRTLAATADVTVEDRGPPDVRAAPGQLAQVVLNLLTNALKATRPGDRGTVVVRLGTGPAGQATIEVADQGTGIAPEILERIFEPFFTTRPTGAGRGTGLGLAVCHSIVAAHGGMIAVESAVGRGSTFRVELPAAGSGSVDGAAS